MNKDLEKHPIILQKIGQFVVLFNAIEARVGFEFYLLINQDDKKLRPILDFLESETFSNKIKILKEVLGDNLYLKLETENDFRNFVHHGLFGVDNLNEMVFCKRQRNGNYQTKVITESILDQHIKEEKIILNIFKKRILKLIDQKVIK